jgi:nucleoside-diphosphate kinase
MPVERLLPTGAVAISPAANPDTLIKDDRRDQKMAIERTFSIIKPDATQRNLTGAINAVIEKAGLRVVAQKRVRWTRAQAEKFYEEHKARPFYGELCDFMTSGPIVVQVLEGENAIAKYREVMGATDPKEAAEGTIRKLFAISKGENSSHGSDSPAAAEREITLNFRLDEIVG